MSVAAIIRGHGMCPRTTPIDTLMAGSLSMHLDVADTMFNQDDPIDDDELAEGFQEYDEYEDGEWADPLG